LAPFAIKVLIVAPGSFRTEGIYGQPFFTSNPISIYDELRNITMQHFSAVPGTQKGDPNKAMEVVVDVVKGEGKAKGRPWPTYLALGNDADEGIRQKSTRLLKHVDEWGDVIGSVHFDT
jgi:predicted metal-dependent enzyme (double-stranded beta helix superfamily)